MSASRKRCNAHDNGVLQDEYSNVAQSVLWPVLASRDFAAAGLVNISRLSMSRSLVSRFCSLFFLHRAFAVVAGSVALHRVSIRTLGELS